MARLPLLNYPSAFYALVYRPMSKYVNVFFLQPIIISKRLMLGLCGKKVGMVKVCIRPKADASVFTLTPNLKLTLPTRVVIYSYQS